MTQLSANMHAEYHRIRRSARLDPGTAGDEGEENWADLLRAWLPASYRVVTKGRLIDAQGRQSGQCDVIVLKPSYPPSLHAKKKYLLAGVAAVFECKLTLRKRHIDDAVSQIAAIKRMAVTTVGTPYRELMTQPICGFLAHSHALSRDSNPCAGISAVSTALEAADSKHVLHPREMIDLICVSDAAAWVATKQPLADPSEELDPIARKRLDPKGTPNSTYFCHAGRRGLLNRPDSVFTPIGIFISELLVKLAWEDRSLREIASYFVGVEFSGSASGPSRTWSRRIYSAQLRKKLNLNRLVPDLSWNEWSWSIE